MEEIKEKKGELIELFKLEFEEERFNRIYALWSERNDSISELLCDSRKKGLCLLLCSIGIPLDKCETIVCWITANEELMSLFNLLYVCLEETGGIHVFPDSDFVFLRDMVFATNDEIMLTLLERLLGPTRVYFTMTTREQSAIMYELSIIFAGVVFGKTHVNPQYVDRAEYAEDMPGFDLPEVLLYDYIKSQEERLKSYFSEAA